MDACVPLMKDALSALARGDYVLPLRTKMSLPDGSGLLGMMPGYLGEPKSFGIKMLSVMHGNHGTGFDSHQGVVMLFGLVHGEPLAILDASAITAIRTAAASAAATDALAREDAGDLALIGSGTQARSHLAAMAVVRPLRRVRIWSRSRANAEALARAARGAHVGVPIEVSATAEEAVKDADLVCTTTSAKEPVLEGAWLSPCAHVNAAGACFPATRELDAAAVALLHRLSRVVRQRVGRLPHRARRGRDRRGAPAGRDRRGVHREARRADLARRHHRVRVARHRARGPGGRPLHPSPGEGDRAG